MAPGARASPRNQEALIKTNALFSPRGRSPASILVGLLWCVALLSMVVIGVLHTSRMDLTVTKNYGDRIQARYLALAGVEKAKALLYHNARDRSRSAKNHTGELYNDPGEFRDVAFGRGQFRVFRRGQSYEGNGVIYGISDEESRLNMNTAATNELQELEGMTAPIAAAIIDWRDQDNEVTPGGAEAEYYNSLQPPYQPRNGPFETIRELLMVRGVTPDLFLGKDIHQNGMLESTGEAEDSDDLTRRPAIEDGDTGWSGIVTVDSTVQNVNAAGQDRVNIQTADEASLTSVRGISAAIARAIVAYRGQNAFQSIADLLDVTAPQSQNSSNAPASGALPGAGSDSKMVSEDLFMDIADDVTADSNQNLAGSININTAGVDVLRCIPGVDRELAQAIVSYRQSSGYYPNVAWLFKVPGMTPEIFKQVAPLVSARSETFRILSEGKINSTGVRQRIQAIVHVGLNDIVTLSYREDDL